MAIDPFLGELITVSEAAEALLMDFYKISPFRWKDPAERRVWLIRNKNRSQADRAFDLLADDKNDELQWLDGAQKLLAPNSNGPGLVGDTLRSLMNPSVSEVLAKRATQMKTYWSDNIGLLLYQWDPPAALPILQRLAIRARSYQSDLYSSIVAALLQLGDHSALGDWAAAIERDRSVDIRRLIPLWRPDGECCRHIDVLSARIVRLWLSPVAPARHATYSGSPIGLRSDSVSSPDFPSLTWRPQHRRKTRP